MQSDHANTTVFIMPILEAVGAWPLPLNYGGGGGGGGGGGAKVPSAPQVPMFSDMCICPFASANCKCHISLSPNLMHPLQRRNC